MVRRLKTQVKAHRNTIKVIKFTEGLSPFE